MDKAVYEGKDISDNVRIIKDKVSKNCFLEVDGVGGNWYLYCGASVESIDLKTPLKEGCGSGTFPIDLPINKRYYFQFVTDDSKIILSVRHLPMEGGYNFRDVGGYRTNDGKHIKWGKLFRADDLSRLVDSDLVYLSTIPVTSIIDFRSEFERGFSPDLIPTSVKNNFHLDIISGDLMKNSMQHFKENEIPDVMKEMYKTFVSKDDCIEEFRLFFEVISQEKNIPLLYHCSAGKDRTGMATALFLLALGVDENTVMNDYLSSNIYLGNKYAAAIEKNPQNKDLYTVQKDYLQAGIDQIKYDHGSIENFLTQILKVDILHLKEIYLY